MQYLTTLLGAGVSKAPGLHESATATGNTGSRAQAASEFARLERERVRLEEKLSMQAVITEQTEVRLDHICRSLEMVRRELDEIPAEAVRSVRPVRTTPQAAPSARTAAAARSASRAALAPPEEEDDLMEPFAVVPFEY
jgi:Ni,Fe-hydrogenase III large subunit